MVVVVTGKDKTHHRQGSWKRFNFHVLLLEFEIVEVSMIGIWKNVPQVFKLFVNLTKQFHFGMFIQRKLL